MSSVASILTGTPAVVNPGLYVGGGGGGSTAPQFTATGVAGAGGFVSSGAGANVTLNNGTFVSYVDTTAVPPGGAEVVVLGSDVGGDGPRWTIGYNNSDVDNFEGADLAIKSYAGDGSLIATPFVIARDTGVVSMPQSLVTNGATMTVGGVVGTPALITGGLLQIDGTLGLGRVYDDVYHLPPAVSGFLPIQTTYLQDLSRVGTQPIPAPIEVANIGATFQVPVTGMYALSGIMSVNVDGVTGATIGLEDSVSITVAPVPPQVGGIIAIQLKPWSVPPTGVGSNGYDYGVTGTDVGLLTAGVDYQMKSNLYNTSGTMAIPDYGFNGSLVSLCS